MLRIYNTFAFQGNLKNKHYFEGWYFKHISEFQDNALSFIPGISLNPRDSHSFIQVIDGVKGTSHYIRYSPEDFNYNFRENYIKVGKSVFAENFMALNIKNEEINIEGEIHYNNRVMYPQTVLSPGIMGWYSYIPFMECKHGIISVDHNLTGSLSVNDTLINFNNGKGYIEKDWGTSFPEAWIWIQSNNFSVSNTSFTFSVAKIPWMGKFFIGFISFLYHNNQFYLFSTYNGSNITTVNKKEEKIEISVENSKYKLHISTISRTSSDLTAPSMGEMTRKIKESINSEVKTRLLNNQGKTIFEDTGYSAGLEITDKIFNYI